MARSRSIAIVLLVAIGLFSTTACVLRVGVVDLGAARVLHGDVPYRDFWTMYAPASFYVLAGAFRVAGRELIVTNVLGAVVAAGAVATCFALAARVAGTVRAVAVAGLFAAAFYGTRYHHGFSSYPPAILLVLLGLWLLVRHVEEPDGRALVSAGVAFGAAAAFKHDVGAYGCTAGVISLLATREGPLSHRIRAAACLVAGALAVVLPVAIAVAVSAGGHAVEDLFVFPSTVFPRAREETFPALFRPWSGDGPVQRVRGLVAWLECIGSLIAASAALPLLWRARNGLTRPARCVCAFAVSAFPMFWSAAHVQINTHAVTLTALAALLAAVALPRFSAPIARPASLAVLVVCAVLSVEPAFDVARRLRHGTEPIGRPHAFGMSALRGDAEAVRDLADAIAAAAPPSRRLLFLSSRNDAHIYAENLPQWLSDREPATRYHELHPGVTDTPAVQAEMVAELESRPLPVVVLEHRFPPEAIDAVRARFEELDLPVGAGALDAWLRRHYRSGRSFGMYEVLRAR